MIRNRLLQVLLVASFGLILLIGSASSALADTLIRADGRHETVTEAHQDSKGRWSAEQDGRRVLLRRGDVVAIRDADGKETDLIPQLVDGELTEADRTGLAGLADARSADWRIAFEPLAEKRTSGILDALVELTADKNSEVRLRAIQGLVALQTRESTVAAATAVLAERKKKLRTEAASSLFAVQEILTRADAEALLLEGIDDAERTVRVIFALIAGEGGGEAGLAVLKSDGLGNRDHHFRESAAVVLGRLGDPAGVKVLLKMLGRKAIPGLESLSAEARIAQLIREQVEICSILGNLKSQSARGALEKAAQSEHTAIAAAAAEALAKLGP